MPNDAPPVPSAPMKTTAIVLALALAAPLAVAGCSKKTDDARPPAPPTATPAGAKCPGASSMDGTNCKATGQGRVAMLTWNGTLGDTAQALTLKNTSGAPL